VRPRIVRSREEIVAVLRERREELNISYETIDAVAGWADGYASKIFAPTPMKNLGPSSLAAILGALALGIARVELIEDPEQAARVGKRWTPRKRQRKLQQVGALLDQRDQQTLSSTNGDDDVQTSFQFPSEA
jgi:hypothetical protein